jgi:hypothetical protein
MKNLKYIQIFEAFESKILSKTLGYIESSDRSTFMDRLKRLCKSIDFPLSKMSDEYFEYLPFKSALARAAMTGDEPCEATSKSEFPQYAVAGEKCTNGKIKRTWGARTRDVVCPVCGGSGVKPKKSEVKLVKFWFTAEGKYVANTLVDGMTRTRGRVSGRGAKFSTRLSDYTVGAAVRDINTLSGGEYVTLTMSGEDNVIAYIYKVNGSNRYYAIQDKHQGSSPSGSEWQRHGRYSWALGRGEYDNMRLLTPKVKTKEEDEVDPYTWNTGLEFTYGGIRANTSADVQSQIKDAHFAIVFDFGKLRKSEFETTQDTRGSREERKMGSKLDPNQSNEEIKKRNIERYVNLLSQKLDISSDIANCNRLISRSLGHKGALYIVYGTNIYSYLGSIIEYYIRFMGATDDRSKKGYADEISEKTNDLFKNGMRRADIASDTIKGIKSRIKGELREETYLQILDLTQQLSDAIYDNLKNYQINDIEDLEVVAQKISSMRNILKSDRYGLSRYFGSVVDCIVSGREDRAFNYLVDPYYVNTDSVLEKLPRVITLISKI